MKTIYRNKRGQYITKKQYEQNQKKYLLKAYSENNDCNDFNSKYSNINN